MKARLILYIFAVLLLVGGSVTAIADQSAKFIGPHEVAAFALDAKLRGVHELPPFVLERVELTPGVTAGRNLPADASEAVAPPAAG